jgi:hypothetical protein
MVISKNVIVALMKTLQKPRILNVSFGGGRIHLVTDQARAEARHGA